ncbi:MAG: DUF973 family protein [Candidatus Thermoplasmatota archaeon]|nr:DUF973 family protein [Candidatus Thermoplasmatota archaeon]MCL5789111.1 DUF973 family protein [Candidatus Thermoplasmatota archaeon]
MADNYGTEPQLGLQNSEVMNALRNIMTFSILSMVGFLIDLAAFIITIFSFGEILSRISSPSSITTALGATFLAIIATVISSAIILVVSFIFLRSGYKTLKGVSERFSSPYTGTNLFFIGLILTVVGALLALGSALAVSPGLIIVSLVIIFAAIIIAFIGQILGLILGSFRLKDFFKESTFSAAGILYIVGIFFAIFSLVGSILLYVGTKSVMKRFK